MSGPYTVTLLQLQPDVAGHASVDTKHELGRMGLAEISALAGKLQHLPPSTETGSAPGIVVRRGDKAWRISAHQGRLRVHHGTSSLDDYWTADSPAQLADLPPFRGANNTNTHSTSPREIRGGRPTRSTSRTIAEVIGLLAVGVVLVFIAARFGTPHRKLSAPPPNAEMVSTNEERLSIYRKLAGTYVVDKKPGNPVVTITPDGRVTYGVIGKDGKPLNPPTKDEQAKAMRVSETAALVAPTIGTITLVDDNAVMLKGRFRFARTAFN